MISQLIDYLRNKNVLKLFLIIDIFDNFESLFIKFEVVILASGELISIFHLLCQL